MSYPPPGSSYPPAPPYTGQPFPGQPYPGYPLPVRTSGLAVGSMVCSFLLCVPGVAALVAVILGFCALPGINRGEKKGRGMAIAGIVIGILGLLVVPAEGYGIYKGFKAGQGVFVKPAEAYVRAVAADDMESAAAMSTTSWTVADSQALADQLKAHGTLTNVAMREFDFRKAQGRGGLTLHLTATFSDGKDVVVSVQMMPPKKGDKQMLVGGAEVLP